MMHDDPRGLGLLLVLSSASCLGLPRFSDDSGDGDTTGASDDAPTTTGPTGADSVTQGPTSTSTTTTPMTTVVTPDLGGPPPEYWACQAYEDLLVECYGSQYEGYFYGYCAEYLKYIRDEHPECAPIFEEYLACISSVECEEIGPGMFMCEPIFEALNECMFG